MASTWPPERCGRCAHADPTEGGKRCGAHLDNRKTLEKGRQRRSPHTHCRNWAGTRTDHKGVGSCYVHGGATPNGRKAGQRYMLAKREAEIEASFADLGYERIGDPYEVLIDLASRAKAIEEWCAGLVARLGQDVSSLDEKHAEQTKADMALFERFMDRAYRFAEGIAKLDIDHQRVRIEQVQAAAFIALMNRVHASPAAALTETQRQVLGDAIHEEVAALEAGEAPEP